MSLPEHIPEHIIEHIPADQRRYEDSLFWVSAHLFPEVRAQLWPARQFPLHTADAIDAAHDVQGLGLQYCVHAQICREPGIGVRPRRDWDRNVLLWTDVPVFTEEPCEWHYPHLQVGYNNRQTDPPALLRPESNRPQFFGFLPNGDLAVYWQIAELLADEFGLEIEAISSSVDGRGLVVASGCDEEVLFDTPVGQGFEVGIVLSRAEMRQADEAVQYLQAHGGTATVFAPNSTAMFYRLALPVMRVEYDMNRYQTCEWPQLDTSCPRPVGWDFRIRDNPRARSTNLFATEHGNLVVSHALFERLRGILSTLEGGASPGEVLPVMRVP